MPYLKVNSVTEAFSSVVALLEAEGFETAPRGMKIKEVLNCCIEVTNPRDRIVQNPERQMNFSYAVGELLWYLSGRNDVGTMEYYSKKMANFSDDGKTLNSAYGHRIFGNNAKIGFNQWEHVKQQLIADPDSRQAIIHLHTPNNQKTKDEVCTLSLQFLLRHGKLNLIVNMRSNDIVLGFTYDAFAFTMLQEIMAIELGVELGSYFHNAGSMHMYERDFNTYSKITYKVNSMPMLPLNMVLTDFDRLIDYEAFCRDFNNSFKEVIDYTTSMLVASKNSNERIFMISLAIWTVIRRGYSFACTKYVNNFINISRRIDERFADILAAGNSVFTKNDFKVIIEGVDASGKTSLANALALNINGLALSIQHYDAPTKNFAFYSAYKSALQSKVSTIFDRFFFSEIAYSKAIGKECRINEVRQNLLLGIISISGFVCVFFVFNDLELDLVISRMDAKDYDKYVKSGLIYKINSAYKDLCERAERHGCKVIKVTKANYDVEQVIEQIKGAL